jgi:hypothetical protein
MRVLVTGGCGYIGSVLVPKLKAAGHEVSIADLMWFWRPMTPAYDFREYKDLSAVGRGYPSGRHRQRSDRRS